MNRAYKLFSIVFSTLLLSACVLFYPVPAAQAETYGDYEYALSEDACTISRYIGSDSDIVVPSEIDGKPVVAIDSNAFRGATTLTHIAIPEGVSSIGDYAFSGCTLLTDLELPEGVESIGRYAFQNCAKLEALSIQDGIRSLGDFAFINCSLLKDLEIADSLTSLGSGMFEGCAALETITLPAGLTSLPDSALFSGCTNLKDIIFPDNLTSTPASAVPNAPRKLCRAGTATAAALSEVSAYITSPSDVDFRWKQTVDDNGAISLTVTSYRGESLEATIPQAIDDVPVTAVGISSGVFTVKTEVTKVVVPAGVKTIGDYAFTGCTKLAQVQLPTGVEHIGGYAFNNCPALTTITVPAGCTDIGAHAFDGCAALKRVYLADSIATLGAAVFNGCTALEEIDLPASLAAVPSELFKGCTGLQEITFPENIQTVASGTLWPTTTLLVCGAGTDTATALSNRNYNLISNTAQDYRWQQRLNGEGEPEVTLVSYLGAGLEAALPSAIDGTPVTALGKGSSVFSNNLKVTKVVVPAGVKTIGAYAFSGCASLTRLELPEGVESYGNYAFSGCSALTTVEIPDGVTSVGSYAFNNCSVLTSVSFGEGLKTLGEYAFKNCLNVTSICFPRDATSIPSNAVPTSATLTCPAGGSTATILSTLTNGRKLKSESEPDFRWSHWTDSNGVLWCNITDYVGANTEVTIPSSIDGLAVGTIGHDAFSGKTAVKSVVIPDGVTIISNNAFKGCSGLESITMSEGVITLGGSAFYGCSSLHNVHLADSITSIGNQLFSGCSALETLALPAGLTSLPAIYEEYHQYVNGTSGYYTYKTMFDDCTSLKEIIFPDNIETIPSGFLMRAANCKIVCKAGTQTATALSLVNTGNSQKLTSLDQPDYRWKQNVDSDGNKTLTITGYTGEGGDIEIPTTIEGVEVVQIGNTAFNGSTVVTGVVIPGSVTSIGYSAFSNCTNLVDVQIPGSVKSIGNEAFSNCSSLGTVVIPDGVNTLGEEVFRDCSSLRNLDMADSVNSLGYLAFYRCTSLEEIVLPGGLTSLPGTTRYDGAEQSMFSKCTSLKTIVFPDNISSIPSGVLPSNVEFIVHAGSTTATTLSKISAGNSQKLTSLDQPDYRWKQVVDGDGNISLTITDYVGEATEVEVPSIIDRAAVSAIGDNAFKGKTAVTSVVIPDGVTWIGSYAFSGCSNLEHVEIPEHVTTIYGYAFQNCKKLQAIEIPDGALTLRANVFSGCSALKDVQIADSVTTIGDSAFSGCTSLEEITLPQSLTILTTSGGSSSYGQFYNCSSLQRIIFPDDMTSISTYTIPTSVQLIVRAGTTTATTLSNMSVGNSQKLTSLDEPDFRWKQAVDGDGNISLTITGYVGSDRHVTVPALIDDTEVAQLAASLFSGNTAITRVTLPITLTKVGASAFSGCTALERVDLPDYLESIGSNAFQNCSKLSTIVMPEELTSLGSAAFYNCTSLTAINVPGSLGEIVDRPSSSGYGVFQNCRALKAVSLGEGLTKVGSYAFNGCTSLESVTLPESLETVGTYAFNSGTTGTLKKLLVPRNVNSIGSNAVYGKTTVYCYRDTQADTWAKGAGHTIVYLDDNDIESVRTLSLPEDFRLICGQSKPVMAQVFPSFEDDVIEWHSSDTKIARVVDGVITAVSQGEAIITASIGEASDSLTVTCYVPIEDFALSKAEAYVIRRKTLQLTTVDHEPQNADVTFTWSSSNTNYATVDANGLVNAIKPGNVTIRATSDNGIVRECLLHVCYPVTEIAFAEEQLDKYIGDEFQLEAQVTASIQNYTNQLVTFTSSDESIATVTEDGVVTVYWAGEVTITATAESGVTGSCVINCHCVTHTPEVDAAVEPTCTETGLTEGSHCSVCDEVLVAQEIVPAKGHTPVTDTAVEPTCTETGLTEGNHCVVCGEVLTVQEVRPALGHDWAAAEYTWADDCSRVTATHICNRDNAHVEEETVVTIAEITRDATCELYGETTYTAIFEKDGFVLQSKSLDDVTPLGHDWGSPEYEWAKDNRKLTATRICRHDASHIETETVDTAAVETRQPTCEGKGETTYSAEFENTAFASISKEVDDIPALGHIWSKVEYRWSDDYRYVTATRTCERDSTHVQEETVETSTEIIEAATCEQGGITKYTADFERPEFVTQVRIRENIPALGHDWGEPEYVWSADNTKVTATQVCRHDAEHIETETAVTTLILIKAPTDTDMGVTLYKATFTKPGFSILEKVLEDIPALNELSFLYLPTGLKEIDAEAFAGTASQAIIIPDGCTTIGPRAFADCQNLLYVSIPSSVTSISTSAFEGSPFVRIDRVD